MWRTGNHACPDRRDGLSSTLILAAIAGVAAFLRFDRLGVPSFWLDEILHQQLTTKAAATPWWRWITALHDEHGSLYYLSQLATRLFGTSEAAGRSAAAFFGVATIPLVWFASRSTRTAALLLAVSPLHVYYSREARGYSLLMFLTAALIVVLLRARSLGWLCAVLAAMLYTAAVAAPVVASALGVAILCALRTRERWYWRAVAACAVTLLLFRVVYAAKPVEDPGWPGFPGLSLAFFDALLRTFTSQNVAVAIAMLLLAIIGAVAVARKNVDHAIVLAGMTLMPLTAAIVSLRLFDHFYAARYVTPALIGFLLLVAEGSGRLARLLPGTLPGRTSSQQRRASRPAQGGRGARPPIAEALIAIVIASQTWTAARREPFQKLDWRGIAATIEKYAKPNDLVIAAEPWSEVSLRHYLDPRVKLVHITVPETANVQRQIRSGVWLVSAGFTSNPATRHWMCRYPLLLASPLESFRLHYASRQVTGPLTYNDGWGDPEGAFRWAIARRATVTVPRWGARDETISMRVLPFAHPSVAPQTMRVSLNGHVLGETALPHRWTERSFSAPARFWVDGENTVVFEFNHAIAPTSFDPKATDPRPLAAAVENLTIGSPLTRITAMIEKRNDKTRLYPLRKEPVVALIKRLGFNPNELWPRLERRELHLDDVIDTLAWGPDCYDDRQFVTLAIETLLQRPPKPHELRELSLLPRDRALGRIAKWDEFRDRVVIR